ncbi:MAG: lysophospholipid acyltransferase family protein [Deltaproteobacteria bacterium]|nr:lysophospholipid acyltransferase family protein [Deltaproteobacteria bacterium]MBW2341618.1 lysophospholipid acyltransferase family protein [Deltaproteobacteria bacterium]
MKIEITNRHLIGFLSYLAISFLRLILLTCRVHYINKDYIDEFLLGDKKVVVTTWHRCAIYFLFKYGSIHPMVLFSSSRDGDLLSDFAKKVGVIPARGSSTRGGKEGSEQLVKFLDTGGRVVATVADGPQGPAFRAKPGLVRIAQRSGVHIMPFTWSATKVWMFAKAWDKMIIPKPFSRIVVYAWEPYLIPKHAQGDEFDMYVKEMEKILILMTRDADAMVNHRDPNMKRVLREDDL